MNFSGTQTFDCNFANSDTHSFGEGGSDGVLTYTVTNKQTGETIGIDFTTYTFTLYGKAYKIDTNYIIEVANPNNKVALEVTEDNLLGFELIVEKGGIMVKEEFTVEFKMTNSLVMPTEDGAYTLIIRLEDNAGNVTIYRYYKEVAIDTVKPYVNDIEILSESNNDDSSVRIWNAYNQSCNPYDYYSIGGKMIIMVSYSEAIANSDKLSVPILTFTSGSYIVDRELTNRTVIGTTIIYTYTIKDNTALNDRDRDGDDGEVKFTYTPSSEVTDISQNATENVKPIIINFGNDKNVDYTVGTSTRTSINVNRAYINVNNAGSAVVSTYYGHMPYAMIAKPFITDR